MMSTTYKRKDYCWIYDSNEKLIFVDFLIINAYLIDLGVCLLKLFASSGTSISSSLAPETQNKIVFL